jgi:hypothetical protein
LADCRSVVLLLIGLLVGCGYGFAGRPAHIPKRVETISIRPFLNKSKTVGVELALAAALEDVIRERGLLRIVPNPTGELFLAGKVRSFWTAAQPVGFSETDQAVIYTSSMVLDVRLGRRADGKILWRGDGLVELSDTAVTPEVVIPSSPRFQQGTLNARDVSGLTNIQLAEDQLGRDTVRELVDAMARSIYSQMIEGF